MLSIMPSIVTLETTDGDIVTFYVMDVSWLDTSVALTGQVWNFTAPTLAENIKCFVSFVFFAQNGADGQDGEDGVVGIHMTYDANVGIPPDESCLSFNTGNPSNATEILIHETAQSGTLTPWLDYIGSITSTAKGYFEIHAPNSNVLPRLYKCTGTPVDSGAYRTFPVQFMWGATNNLTVGDDIYVVFHAAGDKGDTGVSIVMAGAYDAGATYHNNTAHIDMATYDGSLYYAKQQTTGNLPTDTAYWGLAASRGDTGDTGPTGTDIALSAVPANDHSGNGVYISLTAGEALATCEAVYMKSDGKVWKADADAISTMPVIGIVMAAISANASGNILLHGIFRDDSWAWTVGGFVYASGTLGGLTQTQPSGTDGVIQVVGIATHANRMLVQPNLLYITHT